MVTEVPGGRSFPLLSVTAEQRRVLAEWAANAEDMGLARRAQIVLMSGEGLSAAHTAEKLGVSRQTVSLWRRRFAEGGLEAIARIKAGRGRKPSLPPHTVRLILDAARRPPPAGKTRWTVRDMADRAGVSPDTVQRLWKGQGTRHVAPDLAESMPREAARAETGQPSAPSVRPPARAPRGSHNLPKPLGSFVGRSHELAEVQALLGSWSLLTLTGCTGIGKSRLALEAAMRLLPHYPEGAWFVDLAPLAEQRLVPQAVASALGVAEYPGQRVADTLAAYLRPRCVLLVLDNCERVLPGCTGLAATLLHTCPELTILATSQAPMGIPGEQTWQVPPLALPESAEDEDAVEAAEATRLFMERARSQSESFSLTRETAGDVAEICRRLDGNPLAIELAAGRAGTMDLAAMLDRLEHRFRLLTSSGRSGPARHRTLEAAIAWSVDLLPGPQVAVLRRLSVFGGDITLEAAEHVCADVELPVDEVFYQLAALVDRSLVVAEVAGRHARYRLPESIRQFARERLHETGEADRVRARLAAWCGALVEQAEPQLGGAGQQEWLSRLDAEHDNVTATIEYHLADGRAGEALRVAGAMTAFWRFGGYPGEGLALLERCLSAAGPEADALSRAKASCGAGQLAAMLGDFATAQAWAEHSRADAEEAGHKAATARALTLLGFVTMYQGETAAAAELLEHSVAVARRSQDDWCLADALDRCAQAHMLQGHPLAALPLLDECLTVARRLGDRQAEASALIGRGWAAMALGDHETGEARIRLAEEPARSLGDRFRTGEILVFLGELARCRGDLDEAEEHLSACRRLAEAMGAPMLEARALGGLGRVETARRRYEAARARFDQGLTIARTIGLPYVRVRMLLGSSACARAVGDCASAETLLAEALDCAQRNDDTEGTATALYATAMLSRGRGDADRAGIQLAQALQLHRTSGDPEAIVRSLEGFAGIALDRKQFVLAARLFGAADAALQRLQRHSGRWPWGQQRYDRDVARLEQKFGRDALAGYWQEGARWSLERAVATALRVSGGRPWAVKERGRLTPAEREVARLVAQGLTSREAANRLFISPRTVDAHLGRVYRKLGISSRQQLRDLFDRLPMLQTADV